MRSLHILPHIAKSDRAAYLIQEGDRLTGVSGMHHRASYSRYGYASQQKTYIEFSIFLISIL